ncbi:hypothetical protein IJ182_00255 [bacterium]|nr:hypothetical protein [bacterium]
MVSTKNIEVSNNRLVLRDFNSFTSNKNNDVDGSIFGQNASVQNDNVNFDENELEQLYVELQEAEDKQGILSQGFNELKEFTGIGTSSDKCNDIIEQYKAGDVTYEEALAEIEKYENKQDGGLNLISNIATSFAAIGVASLSAAAIIASGGTATPLVIAAIGAGAGAVTKAGIKTVDRATNKVEGDALDSKEIAKDMLSGAVTGATAAATMGTGSAQQCLAKSVINGAKNSARTGAITGAISGSANYTIDCAFDEDKQFNVKDFAGVTASNALVGASVGALVGSSNGALRYNNVIQHGGKAVINGEIANVSSRDIIANSLCSTEHKILNKAIKDIAA